MAFQQEKIIYIPLTLHENLGSVWYIYLKIENCCLKIFVEIHIGKKIYENM